MWRIPDTVQPYAKLACMFSTYRRLVLAVCIAVGSPALASAQAFEALGTRSAGMAGAFVAVADDSSAVYWNPAGLAMGAFFSILIDYGPARALPDGTITAGSRSGAVIALAAPMLGLSYYRLRNTTLAEPPAGSPAGMDVQMRNLVTHHAGVTLVQSLTDRIAVGTTLKLVRGVTSAALVPTGDREELLDEADDQIGSASNEFDADIGVVAQAGPLRAGLTIRNVSEPEFDGPGGAVTLERQFRAGVALPLGGILVAADVDLSRANGTAGEERNFAVGAEAHLTPRVFVRSGIRVNTLGDEPAGHRPVVSFGGSFAAFGSLLLDGQATVGAEAGDRGWGVGARVVF